MKNKKFLYTLLVLVLVLAIGIGYAAVSKDLKIIGAVTTDGEDNQEAEDTENNPNLNANFKVHFDPDKKTVANGSNANASATVSYSEENTRADVSVVDLYEVDVPVRIPFAIVNDSKDLDATIATPVVGLTMQTSNKDTYFSVEIEGWPVDAKGNATSATLAPGESVEFVLVITLIKSPVEHQEATFNITFNAEASMS